jgi:hypothetical protein
VKGFPVIYAIFGNGTKPYWATLSTEEEEEEKDDQYKLDG